MDPKSKKNQKLMKQYPFVACVLAAPMEPFGVNSGENFRARSQVDDLTIKVEKADGDLMYRQAHNIGLGDSSFMFQFRGERKGQVMRRGEYIFAIGKGDKIVHYVAWPRNADEQRELDYEI